MLLASTRSIAKRTMLPIAPRPRGKGGDACSADLCRLQSEAETCSGHLKGPSHCPGPPSSPTCDAPAPRSRPGPSGYTAEILRPLLDDNAGIGAVHCVAELLARAELPASAASALGLGRIAALSKPAGGARGIVVGDFLRRLVARTLAQQFAPAFKLRLPHTSSSTPFPPVPAQRRSCTPCQPLVMASAVSRWGWRLRLNKQAGHARSRPLRRPRCQCHPAICTAFLRLAFEFVWTDAASNPHSVLQAEGGEQGDPFKPTPAQRECAHVPR